MITKALILALIWAESGNNPIAVSPAQAVGLTQLTSIGIKEVHSQYNIDPEVNIFNPETNIKYGVLLLHFYYSQTRSITEALIVYNAGYVGLLRYREGGFDALPAETRAYVPKILKRAKYYQTLFDPILPDRSIDAVDAVDASVSIVFEELYGRGAEAYGAIWGPIPNYASETHFKEGI